MANATAQSALGSIFGRPGLQELMPTQGASLTDILGQLGVNVPAPLEGANYQTLTHALSAEKALQGNVKNTPTFENYFDDPGKVASFVTQMWHNFNQIVQDQGGPPVGILQFVQAAGFAPQVQQMFSVMFGQGAPNGHMNTAAAAMGGVAP